MTWEQFTKEWELFAANFGRTFNEAQAKHVYMLVRDLPLAKFARRCHTLMKTLPEWPKNLTLAFTVESAVNPCRYRTHDRPCGLAGCRTDDLSGTYWYCPYHYARRQQGEEMTDQQEYAFFSEWCADERWPICRTNPSLLWEILCGVVPITQAPRDAFQDRLPWQGVIDGTMSKEDYWGGRKAPSACTKQEMRELYGESPCERDMTVKDTAAVIKRLADRMSF
jgi:hypothetical protein